MALALHACQMVVLSINQNGINLNHTNRNHKAPADEKLRKETPPEVEHHSLARRDGLAGCLEPGLRVHQVPLADYCSTLADRVPFGFQQDAVSGHRPNDG